MARRTPPPDGPCPDRSAARGRRCVSASLHVDVRLLGSGRGDSGRSGGVPETLYVSRGLVSILLAEFRSRSPCRNDRRRGAQRRKHGLVHAGTLGELRRRRHPPGVRPRFAVVPPHRRALPRRRPALERKDPPRLHRPRRRTGRHQFPAARRAAALRPLRFAGRNQAADPGDSHGLVRSLPPHQRPAAGQPRLQHVGRHVFRKAVLHAPV